MISNTTPPFSQQNQDFDSLDERTARLLRARQRREQHNLRKEAQRRLALKKRIEERKL